MLHKVYITYYNKSYFYLEVLCNIENFDTKGFFISITGYEDRFNSLISDAHLDKENIIKLIKLKNLFYEK
jgi:hypothetical protein